MLVSHLLIIQQGLNALSIVTLLLLAALGLGIIFGLMEVVNLAHGAFITIGAYIVFASNSIGAGTIPGLILAPLVVAAIGALTERVIVRDRYDKHLQVLLATWGVSLILRQLIKVIFGPSSHTVATPSPLQGQIALFGLLYSTYRLFLIIISLLSFVAIVYLFYRTDFGVQALAVIQNEEIAGVHGVDTVRINAATFTIGSGLAGLAGAAMAPLTGVNPTLGLSYLLESFFVVIIAGIGNFGGILVVSVLLGSIRSITAFLYTISYGQIIEFGVALALIILIRRQTLEVFR